MIRNVKTDYSLFSDAVENLVFEYVPGSSLLEILDHHRGGIDTRRALRIFEQLLMAVDYLHARNLAHRDLKPANVMVRSYDDMVKLIDFGHAKYFATRDASSKNLSTC